MSYTDEEKSVWYKGASLTETEKKYCRCLLEQQANELKRYGKIQTNAYAICSASIGKSMVTRSQLAAMVRKGGCTKGLHLGLLPTSLLYAYAKMREKTKRGSHYFKNLPTPKKFFEKPESYRTQLLNQALRYQDVIPAFQRQHQSCYDDYMKKQKEFQDSHPNDIIVTFCLKRHFYDPSSDTIELVNNSTSKRIDEQLKILQCKAKYNKAYCTILKEYFVLFFPTAIGQVVCNYLIQEQQTAITHLCVNPQYLVESFSQKGFLGKLTKNVVFMKILANVKYILMISNEFRVFWNGKVYHDRRISEDYFGKMKQAAEIISRLSSFYVKKVVII